MTSITQNTRSVTFSNLSSQIHVDKSSEAELHNKWYSPQDNHNFRRAMARDVRRISRAMATTPVANMPEVARYHMIGAENLLSPEAMVQVQQLRSNHIAAVLVNQSGQRAAGVVDEEALARASEETSRWARERAAGLAAIHWNTGKD